MFCIRAPPSEILPRTYRKKAALRNRIIARRLLCVRHFTFRKKITMIVAIVALALGNLFMLVLSVWLSGARKASKARIERKEIEIQEYYSRYIDYHTKYIIGCLVIYRLLFTSERRRKIQEDEIRKMIPLSQMQGFEEEKIDLLDLQEILEEVINAYAPLDPSAGSRAEVKIEVDNRVLELIKKMNFWL